MTNEEAPKYPEILKGLHHESFPAELLDTDGQVLSKGKAAFSSEESTVTYYLGDHAQADTLAHRAAILALTGGARLAIAQGRRCSCPGPLHLHFEKE